MSHVGKVSSNPIPPETPTYVEPVKAGAFPRFKDSLTSMTQIPSFVQRICSDFFTWTKSLFRKKTFEEKLKENPHKVLMELMRDYRKDPDKIDAFLEDLVKHVHFTEETQIHVDDIMHQLVFSKELLRIKEEIIAPPENMSSEQLRLNAERCNHALNYYEIALVSAVMKSLNPEFKKLGLNLISTDITSRVSVGRFFSTLWQKWSQPIEAIEYAGVVTLIYDFDKWAEYTEKKLREILLIRVGEKNVIDYYPKLKEVIEEMRTILTDEWLKARLRKTMTKLIRIHYPQNSIS